MKRDPELVVRSAADGLRALEHPAVVDQHERALRWRPKNKKAVLIPCSATKPYFEAASHKHGYVPALEGKEIDIFVVSEPMGVIPYAWAGKHPNIAYEFAPKYVRGKTRTLLVERIREWVERVGPKYERIYLALPLHHMGLVKDAAKGTDLRFIDASISECRSAGACSPKTFRATSGAYKDYLRRRVRNTEFGEVDQGQLAAHAIATKFGVPQPAYPFLEAVHEFKQETRRQRKEREREAREERLAAKRRSNPATIKQRLLR